MDEFMVLVGLALALAVVAQLIDELVPVKVPNALRMTGTVLVAIGVCWALDYSVFRAFDQSLRESWMHPIASGVVLVGVGEFIRSIAGGLGLNIRIGGGKAAHA